MTALAVVLGVSMITGTLVFTDTIRAAFHELFGSSVRGAAVVISSRQEIASPISAPATVPASLVRRVARLPGVAAAEGQITDTATIVGDSGRVIRTTGLPTLALSYLHPPFSGIELASGAPPGGPNEVAIDAGTAARQGVRVGDAVSVVTAGPARRFRISGTVRLGTASLGGTTVAVFDLPTARALYGKGDRVDTIYVAAVHGTSAAVLQREIRPLLPHQVVVRTGRGQTNSDAARVTDQLGILTGGLLAFGFVAVLVGAFVIFNTFSITVAQRLREFSLLRALGAMRRQVLGAVLTEAALIGVLGSLVGVLGGLLAAVLIRALFSAVGLDLPSAGLVLRSRTVLIGFGVGVAVTVGAGLLPAARATRAAPLESLREGEVQRAGSRLLWLRALIAAVLAGVGVVLVLTAGGTTTARLQRGAIGSLLVILAVLVVSPLLVRYLADVVSWPIERGGGVVPQLARENAGRNPSRTAISASSLMIGLALVLFVTIYAGGLRDSTRRIIRQSFRGDLTIQSEDGQSSIPAGAVRAAAQVPDLQSVSGVKTAPGRLGAAGDILVEGVDPSTIGQVYRFDWIEGSSESLVTLAPGQALIERETAIAAHLSVGDHATLLTGTGVRVPLTVTAIYSDRALLPGITLSRSQFDQVFDQPRLHDVFVKLTAGADVAGAEATIAQALSSFPGVVVRSDRQLADEVSGRVNSILILFYALLALSVLMSLLGIVNTLNLSIYERTRELGMLRAMGMTAQQARVMVRNEGLITAAIGSVVGVLLGFFLAWAVTRSLRAEGIVFSPPWLQVLGVFAVGLLAGVLASGPPARRASRLDVLASIAHE